MRGALLGVSLCAASILSVAHSGGAVICVNPPPELGKQHSTNGLFVDGEAVTFFFKSRSYPIDIYSGYASQNTAPGSNYCIRYEAINKAEGSVEKCYWPLPGIQLDYLGHLQNMSVVLTSPPGRVPVLDETRVYGFLNEVAKTFAYQKRADNGLLSDGLQLAALEPAQQTFALKDPIKYPDVGADFTSNNENVAALSRAEWDGSSTEIEFSISRGSTGLAVIAPITYAFSKANTAAEVLEYVRTFKNERLPFFSDPGSFKFTRKLVPRDFAGTQSLYVIEQPVTIIGSNGRMCFSAPMYSPMPFPEELLRCNLF